MLKKVNVYYSKQVPTSDTYKCILNVISRQSEFNGLEFNNLFIEDNELDFEKYKIKEIPSILLLDENDELIYKLSGNVPLNDVSSIISYVLNRK
jgi:thioredoxin-related protein